MVIDKNKEAIQISDMGLGYDSNGRRHGLWTDWHQYRPTTKRWECTYINGRIYGVCAFWDELGRLEKKSNFIHGTKEGEEIECVY